MNVLVDVAHSIIIIKRIGKWEFLFYVNMSTLAAVHYKQSFSYCLVCQAGGENKNGGAKNGNLELPWACFYFYIVFYEQAGKGTTTVCLLLCQKADYMIAIKIQIQIVSWER